MPADFSVQDLLNAPPLSLEPGERSPAVTPEQEARAALWELDFALQELEWLRRDDVRERPLLESVARQIALGARHVEAFPVSPLPLPDGLREELADRLERLDDALDDLPPGWAGHEDLLAAHARLRASLAARGVDVDDG